MSLCPLSATWASVNGLIYVGNARQRAMLQTRPSNCSFLCLRRSRLTQAYTQRGHWFDFNCGIRVEFRLPFSAVFRDFPGRHRCTLAISCSDNLWSSRRGILSPFWWPNAAAISTFALSVAWISRCHFCTADLPRKPARNRGVSARAAYQTLSHGAASQCEPQRPGRRQRVARLCVPYAGMASET
jgi:hypothetical protein